MACWCFKGRKRNLSAATHDHIIAADERRRPVDMKAGVHHRSSSEVLASSHLYMGPRSFSLDELRAATNNFSESRVLGKGGSGNVYKGILSDESMVAVKRIADQSRQGFKEFQAELTTIGSLRHRNLVKLKGWCDNDAGSYLLVYEYMANGSLDYLLFNDKLCAKLTWGRRWSTALGLGSALQYLHEECDNVIIHRDVKASNVLLDDRFNAKLGDFGLSREVGQGVTSYTTMVAGTRGYMGPELFMGMGRVTRESDVFAFGGVLLEIGTGKSVIDISLLAGHDMMLLHWVWDMYGQGKLLDVVDKRLGICSSMQEQEEAKKLLVVGLACSHPDPKARPSIRQAMEALNGTAELPWVALSRPLPYYGPLPTSKSCTSVSVSSLADSQSSYNPTTTASSSSGNPLLSASSSDRGHSPSRVRPPPSSSSHRHSSGGSARAAKGMKKTQPLMLKWVMGQHGLPVR